MEPNTAFVMAALALFVSLGSLSVSVATFWRNRTPRPLWRTRVSITTGSDGQRFVTGIVTNRGRGVALDMKFVPEDVGLLQKFAQRMKDRVEFGDSFDITLVFDGAAQGDGAFLLEWSEEPHVHKRRTKRIPFALKAATGA